MRQKLLALLLTVTMLFSMSAAAISALAVSNPTISLEKKKAYVGDEVSIAVSIENNPGIWGMDLRISYDKTAMKLTSVENGNFYQNSEWTKGNLNADIYTLSYEAGGLENISTASGTLATLNFKINENAVPGTYEIKAEYTAGDIINISFDEIAFDISNGSVTVENKPVPVTGIALDRETANIGTGETLTLTPIFSPETATNKNVTWLSSDKTVATVENGIVTPLKKGTTTITVTAEDGGFSASCVVTVNCSHLNTTDVPAEDSTCIKHGHKAYTVCNDCGEVTQGSNSELPLGDHIGGTATCVKKAVCDVCHKEYGNLAAHKYGEIVKVDYLKTAATCGSKAVYNKSCTVCGAKSDETFETGEYDYTNHIGSTYKKNQKEATCYAEGYTGDIYCSTCNHEIEKGTPIAKNAHNPASVWTTDETDHWKECQTVGCGNIIDKAHHSGGEATCVKKAICSVCKIEYGAVDLSNHKHTEVRCAKDATCCEKGYTGDIWCADCNTKIKTGSEISATGNHTDADGKWETDGTNHWHTCYFGTKFDVTAHSGGEATCISKAKCAVCGIEYGNVDASNHKHTEVRDAKDATCCEKGYTGDTWCTDCSTKIFSGSDIPATCKHTDADGKWETDGTNHWHTCYFGTKFDVTAHGGGEATCIHKAVCAVCQTAYGTVNASNHKGTTYLKDQKEPSCYEEGYTGDTYCSDCNVKIKDGQSIAKSAHSPAFVWTTDETDHWKECQTVGCGNIIDKAPHSGGEATCVNKAVCSVCNVAYGEVNPSNHKHTEVRDAKDATCCESGYTGDTWCIDCDTKIFSGSDIPATCKHTDADGKWETDGTNHWHTCYFGTKFDVTIHTGGEATCKKQAECTVCGHSYGELDSNNHKGTTYIKDQKEATCYEEGYTGDTYCSDCNVKIKDGQPIAKSAHNPASVWTTDETDHWKECQTVGCGNIIDKAPHNGGEATCVKKAICSVCNAEYGNLNASNHKHTELRDVKAATEQEKGYTGDTWCLDCNKKIAEGTEVNKLTHELKLVEAKEATVTEQGNIQYYHCDNCDKYFADANGTKEISFEETVIKKLPPEIIEGNNAVVSKNEKKALSFRSNAAFSDFIRVELDGKTLDEKNYSKEEGSIIVTLNAEFVSTLSVGEHTIGIVSESGTATAKFTVKANGGSAESPETGDNNIVVWSLVAVLSLAGLSATVVASKKKRVR